MSAGLSLSSRGIEKNHAYNDHENNTFELPHDKTNKMACAPSEDSDQPGHPIRGCPG